MEDQKEHTFTLWARYIVFTHEPNVETGWTNNRCEGERCIICNAVNKEKAVQAILDATDKADKLDIQYMTVRWPTNEEITASWLWWYSLGGEDEWNAQT